MGLSGARQFQQLKQQKQTKAKVQRCTLAWNARKEQQAGQWNWESGEEQMRAQAQLGRGFTGRRMESPVLSRGETGSNCTSRGLLVGVRE